MSLRFLVLLLSFGIACDAIGQDYFQQEVNYIISATLDDKAHSLSCSESFEYINHSPDTLKLLWIHLWPNAYKDATTALGEQLLRQNNTSLYYATDAERGFIDGLDFTVDGQKATWEFDPQHIDICKLILPKPLLPGQRISVSTPFNVKIPDAKISRLGHAGQQYQITQWYPKPAVYDRNGWHPMPYLHQGEFYSEFGSFDVSITLPKNYVVGATGDLQNEEEIAWLELKAEETAAITTFDEKTRKSIPSYPETKTLRYLQQNVHDFAWFADKSYYVLKGEVSLEGSGKKITTWSMFTDRHANTWAKSIEYINDALYYYSKWVGDYPYSQMTAVDGALSAGAGMEYPNVTVVSGSGGEFTLERTIMHEVGHNWFYGMLASNERKHPWLDEGLNSQVEARYLKTKYPDRQLLSGNSGVMNLLDLHDYGQQEESYLTYLLTARSNSDQPIEAPSDTYTMLNYGAIVYAKSAMVLNYLRAYIGDNRFDECMQTYFARWQYKHPQPGDLRAVFEEVANEDLSWLFDDLIQGASKLDFRLRKANISKHGSIVSIRNRSGFAAPALVAAMKGDSIVASVWIPPFENDTTFELVCFNYDRIVLDPERVIPEINRKNNRIDRRGLLRKVEPLRLQFIGSLEHPEKTQLHWFPALGWNQYNGFMLGFSTYNSLLIQRKFEYNLTPLFGFRSFTMAGLGSVDYHIYPASLFRQITVGVDGMRFNQNEGGGVDQLYTRLSPKLVFDFKKPRPALPIAHQLALTSHQIWEQGYPANQDFCAGLCPTLTAYSVFTDLDWTTTNNRAINPWSFAAKLRYGLAETAFDASATDFLALSLEGNYHLDLNKEGKGIDFRLFFGKHLFNNTNHPRFNWRQDGVNGYFDYTYNHLFLGRTENDGFLARQFSPQMGGFKLPMGVGQSNNWIAALNVEGALPIKLPLSIYADCGINASGTSSIPFADRIVWDVGIAVPVRKDILEIYFPIFHSRNINQYLDANGLRFADLIRFHYNLKKLGPKNMINSTMQ